MHFARRGCGAPQFAHGAFAGTAQVLPGLPATVADVAHNADSAAALEKFLFAMGYFPQTVAIFGMQARKDAAAFVAALQRRINHWFVFCPQDGDGDVAALAGTITASGGAATICCDIADAVLQARAAVGENDRIVVTGSFLVVADFLSYGGKRQ